VLSLAFQDWGAQLQADAAAYNGWFALQEGRGLIVDSPRTTREAVNNILKASRLVIYLLAIVATAGALPHGVTTAVQIVALLLLPGHVLELLSRTLRRDQARRAQVASPQTQGARGLNHAAARFTSTSSPVIFTL